MLTGESCPALDATPATLRIMGVLSEQITEIRGRKGSLTGDSKQRVLAAIENLRRIVLKWPAWAQPAGKSHALSSTLRRKTLSSLLSASYRSTHRPQHSHWAGTWGINLSVSQKTQPVVRAR